MIGALMNSGMSSSLRLDWATPRQLFEMLDREFLFALDACADSTNHKCANYIDEQMDAFRQNWATLSNGRAIWMNPPYGRGIGKWIQKARSEPATVVCLVPARTDTSWWHDYCMKGEVRFLRGRLEFDDLKRGRCPFPSAIVIFRPDQNL